MNGTTCGRASFEIYFRQLVRLLSSLINLSTIQLGRWPGSDLFFTRDEQLIPSRWGNHSALGIEETAAQQSDKVLKAKGGVD